MRTIALYTRAVNIVKKKYVLCKILFCARIITRAAHSARGKKKRLQSKLQPKLLLKYFFVFHNEASDINIVSRGDAADKPAQNNINHKENNIRRALLFIILIYSGRHIGKGFAVFDALNTRVNIPATHKHRGVIGKYAADNLQRGYNKPNDCRCFFVFGKFFYMPLLCSKPRRLGAVRFF